MKRIIAVLKEHFISMLMFTFAFLLGYFNIGLIATIVLTLFLITVFYLSFYPEYKLAEELMAEIQESKKISIEIKDFIKKS